MTDFIEIKGVSGQGYAFRPCTGERLLPATGAVLVSAVNSRRGWTMTGVAETENLARAEFHELLGEGLRRRGAQVFFRLNVSAARRRDDVADLLALMPEAAETEAA